MELIDVYNKLSNKTGKVIKRGSPMEHGEYFLIVDVCYVCNK